MACRVARSYQDDLRMELVGCCECSSAELEMCSTAKTVGPHLCPACAQAMAACGAWKNNDMRPPTTEQSVV